MSTMIRTIILDDIPEQVGALVTVLKQDNRFELVGCYQHPQEAMPILANDKIDLIFSDVEMPGLGGFDFLRNLQNKPDVIFVSAYPEYAVQSFEFEPLHFLSKPLEMEVVLQAIERAYLRISKKKHQAKPFIFIKTGPGNYQKINIESIIYVESDKEYTKLHTTNGMVLVFKRMKDMQRQLQHPEFMRIHRSYIINTDHLSSVSHENILMDGGEEIPLSKAYRSMLKEKMGID